MTIFEEIIREAQLLDWKLWIYIEPYDKLTSTLKVIVLDADNEELGHDDFTPLVAENQGYKELLSIHDLQGVLSNMKYSHNMDINKVIKHIAYYVEYDAYLA